MSRCVVCALALAACGPAGASDPPPAITIVGESTRLRLGDPRPASTPWFDGTRVSLVGARGETLGLQIVHPGGHVRLALAGVDVRLYDVESFAVTRPSTELYGGSHGAGRYADGLVESTSPASNPTYIELRIPRDAREGVVYGELTVGDTRFPVELDIAGVTLPALPPRVWAYADPRELKWASNDERACVAMFREHDVLLSPDLHLEWWPERRADFAGIRDVPVVIPEDPVAGAAAVRAWIAATKGTGHVPFAIPIDEPRTPKRIQQVVALAAAARAAGSGPTTFRFAVTAPPRPEYLGLVDLFIQLAPAAHSGAWAYNGLPPWSGAVVLDAETPGARTWGWLAYRDGIPTWYMWDALYWHDRYNRKGAPLPGRALEVGRDPISFDDGEDHGNLDGVLALPGCRPTLRLAALHRGQQDRALLELAERCDPIATAAVVARTMPRRAWPTDESVWERGRRELIAIAGCSSSR